MSWMGDWQHYKFNPDQSSLSVVGEQGQEIVSHGFRRNIKEHVEGFVKLGKNIKKRLFVPDAHG